MRLLSNWQYRVSPTGNGLVIEHGPDIGCHEVSTPAGERLGWLIGFPIDLKHRAVIDGPLPFDLAEKSKPDDLADAIFERIAGPFLWVMDYRGTRRIYPDITAQVPCVFDPQDRRAALAVPALWPEDKAASRFDRELFVHMRVDAEGWFPAGLTAHQGAHRLLPNHFLDLDSWEMVRFRGADDLFAPITLEEATQIVTDAVAAQMDALHASDRRIALSLTAGRDWRMVAAASAHLRDDITFVTLTGTSMLDVDTQMARRIAGELGLRHLELARQCAGKREREDYIARGGHCVSGVNARHHVSVARLHKSHALVGGVGGELSRGFLWNSGDDDTWPDAETLLLRLGFKPHPRAIDAVGRWLVGLDARSSLQVFDLAYMELREGCWASVQFPCDPTIVRQQPLCTLPSIRAMLGLSVEDKQAARLADAMIERGWPELGVFPVNSLGKTRDLLARIRRVLHDPEALIRRLRRVRS